jgi:hypothetical protein
MARVSALLAALTLERYNSTVTNDFGKFNVEFAAVWAGFKMDL